jgi:hypothetical protein
MITIQAELPMSLIISKLSIGLLFSNPTFPTKWQPLIVVIPEFALKSGPWFPTKLQELYSMRREESPPFPQIEGPRQSAIVMNLIRSTAPS